MCVLEVESTVKMKQIFLLVEDVICKLQLADLRPLFVVKADFGLMFSTLEANL